MYKPVEPIRCPKCGAVIKVDTSVVLCSNPPCYNWTCPNCGEKGITEKGAFIPLENQTFEATSGYIQKLDEPDLGVGITTTNAMGDGYNTVCVVPSIYSTTTHCEICDEEFEYDTRHMHICPKCREAVVKIRKLLDGQKPIQILSVDSTGQRTDGATCKTISFPRDVTAPGTDIKLTL